MSEAVTHGGGDYAYKLCRCAKCKVEAQCTPQFDFYVRTEKDGPNGPLYCYACLCQLAGLPPAPEMVN